MTLEQIIQQQLGNLLFENAKLIFRVSQLQEEVNALQPPVAPAPKPGTRED